MGIFRARIAAALLGVLLICAGCAALGPANHTTGAAANRLSNEVSSVSSAVGSAQLADRRSFATVTDVVLLEALDNANTASAGLTTYLPRGAEDLQWRAQAQAATARSVHAIADARSWVNHGGPSLATVQHELKAASDDLQAITQTLQKASGS